MFKELHAVARHTPLHLVITPQEGGQLKVVVTPLPTGKAKDYEGLSKQFYAIGTPEDLDAEFIPKLNEYASKVNDARAQMSLPEISIEKTKAAGKAEKRASAKAEKAQKKADAKKKKEDAKAAAKAESARKAQEAADRKAAKKTAKSGAGQGRIELPGAAAEAKAPPVPEEKKGYLASLPGKPEVLADYRALVAKHGKEKVGRKFFIKKAETGRRYEKLWQNWADFMKEAAQLELPLAQPPAVAPETAAPAPQQSEAPKPAPPPAPEVKRVPVLNRADRKIIEYTAVPASPGHKIELIGLGVFKVDAVVPDVEIVAHAVHPKPWAIFNDQGLKLGDTDEMYGAGDKVAELEGDFRVHEVQANDRAYTVKDAAPKYQVVTEDGELLIEYKSAPQVRERLALPNVAHPYRVLAIDGHKVTARKILPTKNRITEQGTNELLGHTEEIYELADQVAELAPKDYRVVRVDLDAYVVKLSKPRVVGPAAVAVTPE